MFNIQGEKNNWKEDKAAKKEKRLLTFLVVFGSLYFVALVAVAHHLNIVLQ